jgi:hypothetical protein
MSKALGDSGMLISLWGQLEEILAQEQLSCANMTLDETR